MTKANILATIERRLFGAYWSIGYWDALMFVHRQRETDVENARYTRAQQAKTREISQATAIKSLIDAIGAEWDDVALRAHQAKTREYWIGLWAASPPVYESESATMDAAHVLPQA